ncbi:uncharacterized protein CLUP02_12189 [Colletotrichum lupini]|uniref:Uncharacterized protein n=1 Tax=Colletotrichum lupini TaxID=145971 RepID=A0A9Q8T1S0_9PEZI|nr:uncharacterized protein CLUP02_12189 [Colletotrichum lupini]UQC86687.1 hypothetical protein CLUP02_12189 [Colletotrichum lupini]
MDFNKQANRYWGTFEHVSVAGRFKEREVLCTAVSGGGEDDGEEKDGERRVKLDSGAKGKRREGCARQLSGREGAPTPFPFSSRLPPLLPLSSFVPFAWWAGARCAQYQANAASYHPPFSVQQQAQAQARKRREGKRKGGEPVHGDPPSFLSSPSLSLSLAHGTKYHPQSTRPVASRSQSWPRPRLPSKNNKKAAWPSPHTFPSLFFSHTNLPPKSSSLTIRTLTIPHFTAFALNPITTSTPLFPPLKNLLRYALRSLLDDFELQIAITSRYRAQLHLRLNHPHTLVLAAPRSSCTMAFRHNGAAALPSVVMSRRFHHILHPWLFVIPSHSSRH